MNIQFFCCFHKTVQDIYQITPEEKDKYITFYGVKNKDAQKAIYEYELRPLSTFLTEK